MLKLLAADAMEARRLLDALTTHSAKPLRILVTAPIWRWSREVLFGKYSRDLEWSESSVGLTVRYMTHEISAVAPKLVRGSGADVVVLIPQGMSAEQIELVMAA